MNEIHSLGLPTETSVCVHATPI